MSPKLARNKGGHQLSGETSNVGPWLIWVAPSFPLLTTCKGKAKSANRPLFGGPRKKRHVHSIGQPERSGACYN